MCINVVILIVNVHQKNWNNVAHAREILCGSFRRNIGGWMMMFDKGKKSRAISCNHHAIGPRGQLLLLADLDNKRFTFPGER